MAETRSRYPGAQPFSDNDLSRRTFFGREQGSTALTDQILANRLVVVYAKSGLGKTSLLNAGVAPRLREAASLPLFVRVNDLEHGPLVSILEGIRAEAERQQVEYVEGDGQSLWSFFKSVEFWRNDLLLQPVLIVDQFEELFTLQPEQARQTFLAELGYLVRGVPPPSLPQTDSGASNTPPSIHVVLSLREDFLGILEEAADHLPQIMDHRFRLTPLSTEAAAEAITGPAAIVDSHLATQPFRLQPELVTDIVAYLAKSVAGTHNPKSRYVEPFHLQLICQRIEQVAAVKQTRSSNEIALGLKDLGGEAALTETLATFYANAIQSVPERHLRPVVRRLCEQYLISPEGRRLSLEERELQRQLRLSAGTLTRLVETRLLRTDRRSDSTYYELSHDALVEPVLASRRTQALAVGWAQLLAGWTLCILSGVALLMVILVITTGTELDAPGVVGLVVFASVGLTGLPFGVRWVRAGIRTRERYRRRAPGELALPLSPLQPGWCRFLGWAMLGAGSTLGVWVLLGLLGSAGIAVYYLVTRHVPDWGTEAVEPIRNRPFVEIPWAVAELLTWILGGWILIRQGYRMLWPHKVASRSRASSILGHGESNFFFSAILKVVSGSIVFAVPILGGIIFSRCVFVPHGSLPQWLSPAQVISDVSETCTKGWSFEAFGLALFFFSVLVVCLALLRSGVLDLHRIYGRRRLARWSRA